MGIFIGHIIESRRVNPDFVLSVVQGLLPTDILVALEQHANALLPEDISAGLSLWAVAIIYPNICNAINFRYELNFSSKH